MTWLGLKAPFPHQLLAKLPWCLSSTGFTAGLHDLKGLFSQTDPATLSFADGL